MRLEKVFHSLKTSPFFVDLGIPTFVSVCIPPARRLCELNDQTPAFSPHPLPILLLLPSPVKDSSSALFSQGLSSNAKVLFKYKPDPCLDLTMHTPIPPLV